MRSYKPKIPVFGMPIGLPKTASASSIDIFILKASVIATCIAYTPILLPIKPGVSLQMITPLPSCSSQKDFKKLIFSVSLIGSVTISNRAM